MATATRFATGGSSSPPTPAPATTPPSQAQATQLIMLPASLQAAAGALVNGVPVIALEQAGDSSNESTGVGDQEVEPVEEKFAATSPQFITVTVAEADTVASHQSYQIQYVDQEIYASQTNGGQTQMAYPVYTVGGDSTTLYPIANTAQGQGQYYAAAAAPGPSNTAVANSVTTAVSGTTVGYTTAGGQFVVQHTVDPDSILPSASTRIAGSQATNAEYVTTTVAPSTSQMVAVTTSSEELGSPLGHATKVSPATVKWLLDNYETADGVSLPRSTLYAHYLRHCSENKLEPVNAASFGKLIRSVFLGLRTRRLGTRGNSKYHYYGIRVKPGSSLMSREDSANRGSSTGNAAGKTQGTLRSTKRNSELSDNQCTLLHHAVFLGDGSNAIPIIPEIPDYEPLPDDCVREDLETLRSIYRDHLEAFLHAILSLQFNTVQSLWREFWRSQYNNNGDECEEENLLPKSKLFDLCSLEVVQQFMTEVDLIFYQNLIQVIMPDVLKAIPTALTQSIRNFAKNLDTWLKNAMEGAPTAMVEVKLKAVSAFSSSLRRYTSLNHLAQAARAVLRNDLQLSQMMNDLLRVDFKSVREQASWVCQCDDEIVSHFETDFQTTLQQQLSLEQWASWLKGNVEKALKPYEGRPGFSKAARQFLLNWSFYSSMVIRDLTLRSASSFGSFHLIRLLYDEYMFYLIEHQVAEATGVVPIAVTLEGIFQTMKTFDCSEGEGGGQMFRIALTISVINRIPVTITNIRINRPKPGLMEQHLKGVHLLRDMCNAKLEGDTIGSMEIIFWPGKIRGGTYEAVAKTAASVTLMLQAAIPCALFAKSAVSIKLCGGTNVPFSPSVEYITEVFQPIAHMFSVNFSINVMSKGYYPKGGGKVHVEVQPASHLNGISLTNQGNIQSINGSSFVSGFGLRKAIVAANVASKILNEHLHTNVFIDSSRDYTYSTKASGMCLAIETDTNCVLGTSVLGQPGETAEELGQRAADNLLESLKHGACLDKYCQDQVIIFMALANSKSVVRVGKLTDHTLSAIYVAKSLLEVTFEHKMDSDGGVTLTCSGSNRPPM